MSDEYKPFYRVEAGINPYTGAVKIECSEPYCAGRAVAQFQRANGKITPVCKYHLEYFSRLQEKGVKV